MRPHALITVALCLGVMAAAAIVGCSASNTPGGSSGGGMMGSAAASPAGGGGMMGGGSGSTSYTSPGERVFLAGVGSDGQATSPTRPRAWLRSRS